MDQSGEKRCPRCEETKPLSEFGTRTRNGKIEAQPYCRKCRTQVNKKWKKSPTQAATKRRGMGRTHIRQHGISVEEYERRLAAQGGVCAICKKSPEGGGKSRLSIDHDHSCCPGPLSCGKCVRGLLCVNCNSGIGQLGDDPIRVETARDYLLAWSAI